MIYFTLLFTLIITFLSSSFSSAVSNCLPYFDCHHIEFSSNSQSHRLICLIHIHSDFLKKFLEFSFLEPAILDWLPIRPDCQSGLLPSWHACYFLSLLSWIRFTMLWIPYLPFSWLTTLFCWRTPSSSFLRKYIWEVNFLSSCIYTNIFIPLSHLMCILAGVKF